MSRRVLFYINSPVCSEPLIRRKHFSCCTVIFANTLGINSCWLTINNKQLNRTFLQFHRWPEEWRLTKFGNILDWWFKDPVFISFYYLRTAISCHLLPKMMTAYLQTFEFYYPKRTVRLHQWVAICIELWLVGFHCHDIERWRFHSCTNLYGPFFSYMLFITQLLHGNKKVSKTAPNYFLK